MKSGFSIGFNFYVDFSALGSSVIHAPVHCDVSLFPVVIVRVSYVYAHALSYLLRYGAPIFPWVVFIVIKMHLSY